MCMIAVAAFVIASPVYGQKKNKNKKSTEKTAETTVKAPSGYKLVYNYQAGNPVSYSSVSKIIQSMDINGETMQSTVDIVLSCLVTGGGKDGDNLKLDVKIDTLSQKVESPMGSNGGIISDVAGKSFSMILSPAGKELDLKDAEKLTYTVEGSMPTDISQSFNDFFPDMPDKVINPGETWTSTDSTKSKAASLSMKQVVTSNNKFEGIVNMDGYECAKITATTSGTREQSGEAQGMDILVKGTFTGTYEVYFAVKEGFVVREISTSKLTGTLDISGMQNMSMPLTADMTSKKFIKK